MFTVKCNFAVFEIHLFHEVISKQQKATEVALILAVKSVMGQGRRRGVGDNEV